MQQAAWPPFAPVQVHMDRAADGSLWLTNALPLEPRNDNLLERLRHWVHHAPDRPFLGERQGDGWRCLSFADVWQKIEFLAARLLPLGLSAERPLMIAAPNSIGHAVLALAAMRIGVPPAIVSPASLAQGGDTSRLTHAINCLTPGAIFVADNAAATGVVRELAPDLPILALSQMQDCLFAEDLPAATKLDVQLAADAIHPGTVAKFLFTSGSTGTPKVVPNTHAMMAANLDGLAKIWPFLTERPPVLVDWLPWSHTFGGNYCFNIALAFGGTFHIDDGKPTPALIGRTVQALRSVSPTLYFNVPAGFEALAPHFESDLALAENFFADLDMVFSSGAALPRATRARLESAAARVSQRKLRFLGGWGSTEMAPSATTLYFHTDAAENLGVPMPGVTIKLAPTGDRHELRVRGPNVMPGYWRQPQATEAAFDEDGFYFTGDAGRLADAEHPEQGILFDGRIAENFKLVSGTWVIVGRLRLAVIAAGGGLIADAAIAGHGGAEIGLLIFPNIAACRALLPEGDADIASHPAIIAAIRQALRHHNATQSGGSMRIARFLLLQDPPSLAKGEMTDKGYLNQRAVLAHRRTEHAALFDTGHCVDGDAD